MKATHFRAALLVFALLMLMAGIGAAQTSTTSIYGEVTDPQGAAVVGAKVTLTQLATNTTRTAESDSTGRYQFMGLPPGKYTLKVEQSGFRTMLSEHIELTVNTATKMNIALEVGAISETVTVTEAATGLNTTDASVGNVITIKQVGVLPLEGRSPAALLTLQAGVTYSGDPTDQRSGATSGGRSDQANVTLDGADINDQQTQNLFAPALPIPIDSIQEFRFTTSNPGAEQGRSSGGQVALITKSGSNDFHGSAYWFHRNTATTANDFFNKRSGLDTPKLLRNQFGGSAGGPIWKDRLFFFGNYEGTRRREETNVLTIVPTDNMRDGVLGYQCAVASQCPGVTVAGLTGMHTFAPGFNGLTPAQLASIDPGAGSPGITPGVNAAMISILQSYPTGNDCTQGLDAGINFCGFRFNAPVATDQNIYVARFDYNITSDARHMVSWRGTLNDLLSDTTPPQFPGHPVSQQTIDNSKGFATTYTAQLSNTMTNVFRYNLTRQGLEFSGQTNVGFGIRSYTAPFSAARAAIRAVPNHNFVEDFSWVKGNHTMQFGGTARLITNDRASLANSFPAYAINDGFCLNFCSDVDNPSSGTLVAAGLPAVGNRNPFRRGLLALYGTITQVGSAFFFDGTTNVLAAGQAPPREFKYNEWEFYFQDTWRWTKNLTVTYGMRYGLYGVPYETNGLQVGPTVNIGEFLNQRIAAMNAGLPSASVAPLQWDLIGKANDRPGYYQSDKNNFAPTVSFAYSPNFSGNLLSKIFGGPNASVIRGGFRVVFDRIGGAMVVSQDLNGAVGLVTPVISPTSTMGFGGPVCATPPSGPCQAPRFSGLNNLPVVADFVSPPSSGFPTTPSVSAFLGGSQGFAIDNNLRTPYSYTMQLTYGRQLPGAMDLEVSYIGRLGQKLLAKADIAAPLIYHRDPTSGQTFAEAINALYLNSQRGALDPLVAAQLAQITPIPYFENLFTGIAGFCTIDPNCTSTQTVYEFFTGPFPSHTDVLANLEGFSDLASPTWFQQQFNSLPTWTNLARSNFHSLQTVVRKRFTHGLTFDINYTYGRSLDNASSIENVAALGGQIADIFNPKNQYALSSFDLKHQLTSNWVYELPFGRGKWLGGNAEPWLNQVIGGWQTSGIFRWRGAFPLSPANGFNFPTNFFLTPPGTWTCDPNVRIGKNDPDGPNLFGDDFGASQAIQCLDFTLSGGSGSRNAIRGARFSNLDFALRKTFGLPIEGHRFVFEWQAFNLLNHANFDDRTLNLNPESPSTFGRYTGTIGQDLRGNNARVMQFTLRYDF